MLPTIKRSSPSYLAAFLLSACGAIAPEASALDPRAPSSIDAASQSAPSPRALKIATWNLEWLHRQNGAGNVKRGDADYARLRRYADRLDADVVAFQEVDGAEAAQRVFDPAKYDFHVAAQTSTQRTGFAYKKGLEVSKNVDYGALDVGDVRAGTDLSVRVDGKVVRLLSVHLKSGCFEEPLSTTSSACIKLAQQVAPLEAWIDARAREGVAAIVLGDFNRRFFGVADEPFWREIDDASPPASDLSAPTDGLRSRCWNGEFPEYIDHLVLNLPAAAQVLPGSFMQHLYDPADEAHKSTLSDHCPLSLALAVSGSEAPPANPDVDEPAVDAAVSLDASLPVVDASPDGGRGLIKGNINDGRKLYHLPACPGYASTQIDEAAGERWFVSEAEALAAGWTKAGNCPS